MYAILSLLILLVSIGAESTDLLSCLPARLSGSGFVAKFYDYELSSKAGWDPDFFKSGYRTRLFGTKEGITNVDFEHKASQDTRLAYAYIYGQRTKNTSFATEYTGYFFAKDSGRYSFNLTANSGASLQFGSNGICCDDVLCSITENSSHTSTTPKDGSGVSSKSVSLDLIENLYYPMKLVYFNSEGDSKFSLQMKNPQGDVLSDFSDYVWQVTFKDSICYTTVFGRWSGTSKSISTHKVDITSHHTEIVHVLNPTPRSTATLTWDQPNTSTKVQDNGPTVLVVVYAPRLRTTVHEYRNVVTEETESFIGNDSIATIRVNHRRKRVHAIVTENIPSTSTESIEDGETLRIIEHRPRSTTFEHEYWNGDSEETEISTGKNKVETVRVKHPRKRVHAILTEDILSISTESIEDGEKLRIIEHQPRTTFTTDEYWNSEAEETEKFTGEDQVATVRVMHPRKRVRATVTEDILSMSTESIEDGETLRIIEHQPRTTFTTDEYWNSEAEETEKFTGEDQVATVRVMHPRKRVRATVTEDILSMSTESIEDGETLRIIEHQPRTTFTTDEYWNSEAEETEKFTGEDQVATVRVKHPRKRVRATVTEDILSMSTESIEDGETLRIIEHQPRTTFTTDEYWNGKAQETISFIGDNEVATVLVMHPRKRVHATVIEDIMSISTESIEDGDTLRIIEHKPRATFTTDEYWNGEAQETDSFMGDDQVATVHVKHPRKRVHATVTENILSISTESIEDGDILRIIEYRPYPTVRINEFWNSEVEETDSFIGENEVATVRVKHPQTRVHAILTEDILSTRTEATEDGETLRMIEDRPFSNYSIVESWQAIQLGTHTSEEGGQMVSNLLKNNRGHAFAPGMERMMNSSLRLAEGFVTNSIIEHELIQQPVGTELWEVENNRTKVSTGTDQTVALQSNIANSRESLYGQDKSFEVNPNNRAVTALNPVPGLVSQLMNDPLLQTFEDQSGASERTMTRVKSELVLEEIIGTTQAWVKPGESQFHDRTLFFVNVTTSSSAFKTTVNEVFNASGVSLDWRQRLCTSTFSGAQFSQAWRTREWDDSFTIHHMQISIETDAHSEGYSESACSNESREQDKANLTRSEIVSMSPTAFVVGSISSGCDVRSVHSTDPVVISVSASSITYIETRHEYSFSIKSSPSLSSCALLPRVPSGKSITVRITSMHSDPGTEVSLVNYSPLMRDLPDIEDAVNGEVFSESIDLIQTANCAMRHCTSQHGDTSVGADFDFGMEGVSSDENLKLYSTVICKDHCTLNVETSRIVDESSDEHSINISPVSPLFAESSSGFITFEKASSSLTPTTTTVKKYPQVIVFEGAACKTSLEVLTLAVTLLLWLL